MKRWYNVVVKVGKEKKLCKFLVWYKNALYWKRKKGGISSSSIYYKSFDFPWSFPALLGQELALPLFFQLVFWQRGLLCWFSDKCIWGSCPAPCRVPVSVEAVYPVRPLFPGSAASPRHRGKRGGRQQWRWPEFQLWSQLSAVTNTGSQCAVAWSAQLAGHLLARESSLSCALPASACPRGSAGSWALSAWCPGVQGPVLLGSCSWWQGSRRQQDTDTSVWSCPPNQLASPKCPSS